MAANYQVYYIRKMLHNHEERCGNKNNFLFFADKMRVNNRIMKICNLSCQKARFKKKSVCFAEVHFLTDFYRRKRLERLTDFVKVLLVKLINQIKIAKNEVFAAICFLEIAGI